MNPQDAVEPLSSIVKPLPWELANFVAYFLLGALLPATLLAAIAGVPVFLQSAEANPIAWGVLVAVFAYPLGLLTNSIGKVLRQVFWSWIPDRRYGPTYERLKNQANAIASAVEELVFRKKVGGELQWYLRVACLIAPNYLPYSAGNLKRQDSFLRFHTTMLAVVLLNTAVLLTGAVLRMSGALSGRWLPFAASALAAAGLTILIEYATREQNDHILDLQVQLAGALLAVLEERGRPKPENK